MASAASGFEVHPLQQLLERDRRRGDRIVRRLSTTLSSLTIARAPSEPAGELADALAPDTWIGSGEGTQDFSRVFGSVLPAEGAIAGGERHRSDARGSLADLFEHLEGVSARVAGWAEKTESAAKKVQRFAGSAEKFLADLGLHELAGAAAKAATAADWVEEKAEVVRSAAETADRWMGEAKNVVAPLLDSPRRLPDAPRAPPMETLNLRRPPADFRVAAEGEGDSSSVPRRTRSRGDEVAGKDAPADGEELLEEVSGRVYELLMDDLEQAFESR